MPGRGKCRQLTQSAFSPLWFFNHFVLYTWATSSAVQTEGTHLQIITGKYTQRQTPKRRKTDINTHKHIHTQLDCSMFFLADVWPAKFPHTQTHKLSKSHLNEKGALCTRLFEFWNVVHLKDHYLRQMLNKHEKHSIHFTIEVSSKKTSIIQTYHWLDLGPLCSKKGIGLTFP